MGQRKRRADGLLERKRTIDGKVVHFTGILWPRLNKN